jgi:DMSO reductase family type II enzyme molybdopterin subunit
MELSRRSFLHSAGAAAVTLTLANLQFGCEPAEKSTPEAAPEPGKVPPPKLSLPDYRQWEDLYRQKWTWDRIVKGTHLRTNCIAACSWNLFVKDGIVWREEQNTIYKPSHPTVPDMNPRGCQKGNCYSQLMYEPSRIKYPLRRQGERGSGRWQRQSWDDALGQVADTLLDVALRDGPDCVVYDHGTTNIDFGTSTAAEMRFFALYGATSMDSWAGVGDLPMGAIQTWGHFNADGTSDDWFNADYILIWIANPVYTRIPDVHFMWEARYRGATVVSIAPDYNASSIHADLGLNPRMGTAAARGLAMAQVIISDKLFRADYVREQTDLPFLIRTDTGRYLRHSDIQTKGKDDVFYFWDEQRNQLTEAPGTQGHKKQDLRLGAAVPALQGRFPVTLANGASVEVRPLLEVLREHLKQYTPERAAAITGVQADTIRRVARGIAAAKVTLIFASWGACKHYHSDLAQRSMCLLTALTGSQGKRGGGMRPGAWYDIDALDRISYDVELPLYQRLLLALFRPKTRDIEDLLVQITRQVPFTATLPFLYVHGGLKEVADRPDFNDPTLPRPVADYVREATAKGWMPVSPPAERPPRVYFYTGVNPLRRWPAPQLVRQHLWPKLDLIVNVNPRMCSTGLESDVLLPAAGYYEKIGLKYPQSLVPYIVFGDQAVTPLDEAKSEFEIFGLLARKLQERARARGVKPFKDHYGLKRDYANFYERWSLHGEMKETDEPATMDWLIRHSSATKGFTWQDARQRGALPIQDIGRYGPHNAICSDFKPGNTIYPQQWFVEKKEPWPTLTGRQQFLIDHPWYVEVGEALPVHKEPPPAGGNYPLRLNGGHTRWSIHAIWRDQRHLLRLQRGEPVMYMNNDDARKRGLKDHDYVRVFNDVGSFHIHVKPTPALQPGQVVVYHAWENHQFKDWMQSQVTVPSPWKPSHLAGDYGHLHYRMYYAAPSHGPRGTTVEVERA